jgi:hypothetical protein
MKEEILKLRLAHGKEYVTAICSLTDTNWIVSYENYLLGNLGLAQSFALIHPSHYESYISAKSMRGLRNFSQELGLHSMKCSSRIFWGYDCPFNSKNIQLVADHIFPYSLGGPTEADNKAYLCSFHNQLKGNDIHFFPWEFEEPPWLGGILKRISLVYRGE